MKLLFLFLLSLGVSRLRGQQRTEEFEQISLQLPFPAFYNGYNKSCCKLYPGGCYKLLDSAGFTCDLLRGRVTKTERDGWVEFKISNVRFMDGGYYRCAVLGAQTPIYKDFYVEVYESSHPHSQPRPSPTAPAVTAPSSPNAPLDLTGPALEQDRSDGAGAPWRFSLPLAVIVSIALMIFITSVIGAVCCRVKAKQKQSDKHGKYPSESPKQEASELSGIVYTTVDFRAHQKPEEVYANMRTHGGLTGAPDAEHAGMVEYSILAIHR